MERPAGSSAEAQPGWRRPAVLIAALIPVSLVAGGLPSFTLAANLMVLGVGAALCWLGRAHPEARRPAEARRSAEPRRLPAGAWWWLLPALLFAAVELTSLTLGSGYDHPTLSTLTDSALDRPAVRSVLFFGWSTAFLGLVRR